MVLAASAAPEAFPEERASTLAVLALGVANGAAFLVPVLGSPIRDQPTGKKQRRRVTTMTTKDRKTRKMARLTPNLDTPSSTVGRPTHHTTSYRTTFNVAERIAMSWLRHFDAMGCGFWRRLSCCLRSWLHWAWW